MGWYTTDVQLKLMDKKKIVNRFSLRGRSYISSPSSHFVPKSITPLYKTSQSLQGSFLVMNTENMFVINSIFSLWLRKIKKMCDVTFLASLFPHSHKSSNMNGPFFLTSNTIHKYPVYYKLILISFTI